MAPNNKSNESLMLLFICLLNLKDNAVDFSQVAAATNLKTPAARMRFSRLKKQLEVELVNGKYDLTKGTTEASEPVEAAAVAAPDEPTVAETAAAATASPAKKKRGGKRKKTVADDEDDA